MAPRWLACVVVGLATQAVYAQTAPVAAPDYQDEEEVDAPPSAPSAPPTLPDERPTARPFGGAVWTSGHYFWDGSVWRFKPGAWVAPMKGYHFINGYWRQEGAGWRWISRGWARAGSNDVEIPIDVVNEDISTQEAPPPAQTEAQPVQPVANATWAPGYWYWSGSDWVWIDGSWVTPPQTGLVFVSPRWVHRGGAWVFVDGGWAYPGSLNVVIPVYRHAGIAVRWGHPNYFLYSWRRYPAVHHYYYGYSGRPHYNYGWRSQPGRGGHEAPGRNYHPATPVHGASGGGGGGHHHR